MDIAFVAHGRLASVQDGTVGIAADSLYRVWTAAPHVVHRDAYRWAHP